MQNLMLLKENKAKSIKIKKTQPVSLSIYQSLFCRKKYRDFNSKITLFINMHFSFIKLVNLGLKYRNNVSNK